MSDSAQSDGLTARVSHLGISSASSENVIQLLDDSLDIPELVSHPFVSSVMSQYISLGVTNTQECQRSGPLYAFIPHLCRRVRVRARMFSVRVWCCGSWNVRGVPRVHVFACMHVSVSVHGRVSPCVLVCAYLLGLEYISHINSLNESLEIPD